MYRIIHYHNIPYKRFTDISDNDLKKAIQDIKENHPHAGEVYLLGHLRSRDIYVPRSRLRDFIHAVDQAGISMRQSSVINRRVYWSPCPNFVWHLDGLHKMVRWKFVVHGGIDGYSRLIVFLSCATNNRALTVLEQFNTAVEHYGWPLHVRTDHGGENSQVWHAMTQHHNTERSVIAGSSVHNERIERMWRDINRIVSSQFREMFYHLESGGILDPLNEADLFCLLWVYSDLINKILSEHTRAHNHHGVSTEGNFTPLQLHHANIHLMELHRHQNGSHISDIQDYLSRGTTDIEHVRFQPPSSLLQQLRQEVPCDEVTMANAVEMYRKAVHFVGTHLLENQG